MGRQRLLFRVETSLAYKCALATARFSLTLDPDASFIRYVATMPAIGESTDCHICSHTYFLYCLIVTDVSKQIIDNLL